MNLLRKCGVDGFRVAPRGVARCAWGDAARGVPLPSGGLRDFVDGRRGVPFPRPRGGCGAACGMCQTQSVATNRFRSFVDPPTQGDSLTSELTSQAGESKVLGPVDWLRWGWRSLTMMRTALVLLLLLALAAVPGALVSQEVRQPAAAGDFRRRYADLAPLLDRLGFFDVYASPWFVAVYLLFFVSVAGWTVPTVRQYVRILRSRPPTAPSRLDRLPQHVGWTVSDDRREVLRTATDLLRRRRFRFAVALEGIGLVAAEGGEGIPARGRKPGLPRGAVRAPQRVLRQQPLRHDRAEARPRKGEFHQHRDTVRRLHSRHTGLGRQPPAVRLQATVGRPGSWAARWARWPPPRTPRTSTRSSPSVWTAIN